MTERMNPLSPKDLELLSATLDGALSAREQAALDARLQQEAGLRAALAQLRETRAVLRRAPRPIAPRSYALRAEMLPARAGWFERLAGFAMMRTASLVAMVLFVLVTGSDVLFNNVLNQTMQSAAPAAEVMMAEEDTASDTAAGAAMNTAAEPADEYTEKSGEEPLPAPTSVGETERSGSDDAADDMAMQADADESMESAESAESSEASGGAAADSAEAEGGAPDGEAQGLGSNFDPPTSEAVEQTVIVEDEINPYAAVESAPAEETLAVETVPSVNWLRVAEAALLLIALAAGALAWRARRA